MVMMQIGSMPKELTMQNIDAFAEGVLPRVHGLFEDEWENKWWPERLRKPRADVAQPVGATEPAVTERVGAGSGRNRGGS
jgi:hypothetical protein